jgi:diaminohydroxyphosphoribosylaminopyrimidine deaminase/5-amino-6-(5-phosphoribosylamino)uracil reductase
MKSAPEDACSRWSATGARLIACEGMSGGIDVADALRRLAALGLTRVLCEGGGQLAASILREGLATEVVLYSAGRVLGADGRAAVGPMALAHLADAPRLSLVETAILGDDVMTRWTAP